jgi:hypothetical protein
MSARQFYSYLVWMTRILTSLRQSTTGDALWLYDNFEGPDGFYLIKKMGGRVKKHVNYDIMGPQTNKYYFALYFIFSIFLMFPMIFTDQKKRERLIEDKFRSKFQAALINYKYIICGSTNSKFVELASKIAKSKIIEVQHGHPDPTYFERIPDLFFARSKYGYKLATCNGVDSIQIACDLNIPICKLEFRCNLDSCILFSKNEGGGCSRESLTKLERSVISWCNRTRRNLKIILHPRDNLFKFLLRHKSMSVLHYIFRRSAKQNIIISSMSTAIFSNSVVNDVIINIELGDLKNQRMAQFYSDIKATHITGIEDDANIFFNRRIA